MNADWLHGPQRFPTTSWSLVVRAARRSDEAGRRALGELLERYLPALRAHLVRARNVQPDDADDLLHEFVAAKILERDLLARADQELGKFRTFLLTSLDRFCWNRRREAGAKKRSAAAAADLLGDQANVVASPRAAADTCEIAWARSVLGETLRRMRASCEASSRADLWGVFEARVLGPCLEGAAPADYGELVARFNLQSPGQAFNVLATAKRTFARTLRAVIAEYARDEPEIEEEIRELHAALAGSGLAGPLRH